MTDPNEDRTYRAGLDTSQGGDCMTPAECEREDAERQAELDHDLPLGWHRSLYGGGLYYQERKP